MVLVKECKVDWFLDRTLETYQEFLLAQILFLLLF